MRERLVHGRVRTVIDYVISSKDRLATVQTKVPDTFTSFPTANNIESIVAGFSSFEDAFQAWLDSPAHRPHLLGETSFNADQIEFGVGYAFDPDSTFQHYYVFISAYRE